MINEPAKLTKRHERLQLLYQVSNVIHSTLDSQEALQLIVSEAVRLNWPHRRELFDFLMPSMHAPITPAKAV